jgi:hypothetical protein
MLVDLLGNQLYLDIETRTYSTERPVNCMAPVGNCNVSNKFGSLIIISNTAS